MNSPLPEDENIHTVPGALKALQDDIYREKILRARKQTPAERLAVAFALTNCVFERMHQGAMWQLKTSDPEIGWREVRRRLERLSRTHDHGRYTVDESGQL